MSHIDPVILWEEEQQATKLRTITIYKSKVHKDIELHTHKYVDAASMQDVVAKNAVEADAEERIDAALITSYVDYRDAILRDHLQHCLVEEEVESADNSSERDSDTYVYSFTVPQGFHDTSLKPLAKFIHRYLLYGSLCDWYSQTGNQQASVYEKGLQRLEDLIDSTLRGPSIVKRPLQPFGPAKKPF